MAFCAHSSRRSLAAVLLALSSSLACGGGAFATKDDSSGNRDSGGASYPGSGGTADSGMLASGGRTISGAGGAGGSGGHGLGGGSSSGGTPSGGSGGALSTGGKASGGAGGAPTSTIQLVTSYDRKCATDGDCVMVVEGDVCGCPGCQGAAIARSAQATWDADRKRIYCPAYGVPTNCPAIACAQMVPACADGLCIARYPHTIDASKYDASCRTNDDCKVIYTGEVCSVCRCSTAAVNGTGYAQYQKDIANDHCTPGPSVCDCAPRTAVSCQLPGTTGLGTCVMGP